jgi:NitT/TauT family transport system substrate-binding protein
MEDVMDTDRQNRRISRRNLLVAGSASLAVAALAACRPNATSTGSSSPAAGSGAAAAPSATSRLAQPATMTPASQVMNWFAQSAHGGQFSAAMSGYYDQLNVKMTTDQGGPNVPVTPLLASGKYTFGMLGSDQVLLARQDGVPLVGVFAPFQVALSALMFHQDHPVNSFADLQGRKVYVTATSDYWLYIVKKYNLDKAQQMTYNGQLQNFLADETAVQQCFVSSEPLAAKKQGVQVGYIKVSDSGFNAYSDMLTTTEQTIKEKPDVVQAFVTASLKGWRDYLKDPTATLNYIKSLNKDTDLDLSTQAAAVEKPFSFGPNNDPKAVGTLSEQRFHDTHDQLRSVGLLKSDIDYKAAFNSTFIDAAQNAGI